MLRFDRQGRQIDSVPGGHLLTGTGALHSSEPASSQTRTGKERKYDLESRGFTLDKTAARVAEVLNMKRRMFRLQDHIVEARSFLCYWAVRELRITMSSIARRLNISVPAVSKSPIQGEKPAKVEKYLLAG